MRTGRMHPSFALALAAPLALAACIPAPTRATDPATARPAPAARVYAFATPGPSTVPVRITRDAPATGLGSCFAAVYVGAQLAVRLDSGESVALQLAPGDYSLSVGHDPQGAGLCATTADESNAVRPAVPVHVVDAPIYVRVGWSPGTGTIAQIEPAP
jgi:hypothetical protein